MVRVEADAIVREALSRLTNEQPELFRTDVSERALTHHLANYISAQVSGGLWVDVEYNRHQGDPKRLNLPMRDTSDRELRATTVFPDIIVHARGTNEQNLVVLEVKKEGQSLDYDDQKLRAFSSELGYRHPGHVIIGVNTAGQPRWTLKWL